MLPETVCIPVRNEEKNVPNCLEALAGSFSEVVFIDSGSGDRTREIAENDGAKVMDFVWDGGFPKKRNWALRRHDFKNSWVLFLDADERVTPAFVAEIQSKLETESETVGFWLRYDNWFMGKKLKHGDPMRKLALFRIGSGEYEQFPEESWSSLDMEVHEHPVLTGEIGEIGAPLEHHDFRGIESYIHKHNEYSTWEANRFKWLQTADSDAWDSLNPRQRFKYRNLDKWWLGTFYFLVTYVVKKGFLDGMPGYHFAKMKKRYFEDIRLKILEARSW